MQHSISNALTQLEQNHLKRVRRIVTSPQGALVQLQSNDHPTELLSFASNDYLGLANHPRLKAAFVEGIERYGVGAGASHLVSGHMSSHHDFEQQIAQFFEAESALLFSSGYAANLGILTALANREAVIYADKLNHACLNDGALLSRATFRRYGHLNLTQLRTMLIEDYQRDKNQTRVIATDAVFSMDGDIAPLSDLLLLAREFDAWLVVDDAHGFGVLGKQGRGSLDHCGIAITDYAKLVYMATLGKSAGIAGAFVVGTRDMIEWLVNRARPYIFATAMPPAQAYALSESLKLIQAGDALRANLYCHIQQLRDGLLSTLSQQLRGSLLPSITAIQPLLIGTSSDVLVISKALEAKGLWVPAIRPPTVPEGKARLRISISAAHSAVHVDHLLTALCAVVSSAQ